MMFREYPTQSVIKSVLTTALSMKTVGNQLGPNGVLVEQGITTFSSNISFKAGRESLQLHQPRRFGSKFHIKTCSSELVATALITS